MSMKYPYRDLGVPFDRNFRNDLNANFDDIEHDIRMIGGEAAQQALEAAEEANTQAIYAQTSGDYANDKGDYAAQQGDYAQTQGNFANEKGLYAQQQGDYAKAQGDYAKQVGDENKTRWLTAVNTYADIATTYPNPQLGDTVQTIDDSKIYRWDGTQWVWTQQYNANAITDVQNKIGILSSVEVNIKNYNPYLDGVNDDSTAINNAINAVNNAINVLTSSSVRIVFPYGKKVKISQPINFVSNLTIDFMGCELIGYGDMRPISIIGTQENPIKNAHVKNVKITLQNGAGNQSAIRFDYAEDCSWENVSIITPALNGIEVMNSKRVHGRKGSVLQPQSFGIIYYNSEYCTDKDLYIYRPNMWAHQFKSCFRCVSYDIQVIEPQSEYGLYMWSGYGTGVNAPRENKYCGYVNPYVKGAPTSKHLIYINASPDCFIENPVLEQAAGGWTPIAVGGQNTVDDGQGGSFTTDSSGCRIVNPKIICAGTTEGITFAGVSGDVIESCEIVGGTIKNAGTRAIYCSYAEKVSVRGTKISGGSKGVEASNSIVECVGVTISNNSSDAFLSANSSVLKLIDCESFNAGNLGVNVDSTSVVVVNGGAIKNSVNSAMLINGTGGSFVGGGLRVIGARTGAGSFDAAIKLLGSNVLINNVIFDVGGSTKLDSFIKESGSASNNKIGKNNIYIGTVGQNVFLLTTSGSKGEDYGTAAPTSGTWPTGFIRWNTNPAAGGYMGWVCVSGGTPGTWKGFGAIQA
jgi:hypothetical protein